jgi:hypothetical protein
MDPYKLHAWVEIEGKPVETARDEPAAGVYRPLFKV